MNSFFLPSNHFLFSSLKINFFNFNQNIFSGLVIAHDMTWFLKNYTYWPSYNIPYFKTISEISGYKQKGELADWYKWESCPRAKIFNRDHHKVTNLDSLQKLMRY